MTTPPTACGDPVVVCVPDDGDLYRWIHTRRRYHATVVPVLVEVVTRQAMSYVADATLVGMGKDPWLSVSKRPAEALAVAWMTAGGDTDALIGFAQTLSGHILDVAPTLYCGAGVTPWFVFSTTGDDRRARRAAAGYADRIGVELTDADVLLDTFADTAEQPDDAPIDALPPLPRVDGIRFRSTAKQVLSRKEFRVVDARFVELIDEFLDVFATTPNKRRFVNDLERQVHARLRDTASLDEFVLTVRAAQVAGLRSKLHVAVDTTTMLGAAASLPRPGLAGPQRWWEALDTHRDPDPGAAAALYNAGIDAEDLCSLRLADIASDGDGVVVTTGSERMVIDDGARFVRALVTLRTVMGASEADPLFSTHRADVVRPQHITALIWGQQLNCGVSVAAGRGERRHPSDRDWLARHGITIARTDAAA